MSSSRKKVVYLCGFESFGMAGMDVSFGYYKEAFNLSCFLPVFFLGGSGGGGGVGGTINIH